MPIAHPRRVQVTGDRFHPAVPAGALYAGREGPYLKRSPYANPHPVGDEGRNPKPCPVPACEGAVHTRAEALRLYQICLDVHPEIVEKASAEAALRFACRCPLDLPCHLDALLTRVDALTAKVDALYLEVTANSIAAGRVDASHLHTAKDVEIARLALMDTMDKIPNEGAAELHAFAAEITEAIDRRAAQLGLEMP